MTVHLLVLAFFVVGAVLYGAKMTGGMWTAMSDPLAAGLCTTAILVFFVLHVGSHALRILSVISDTISIWSLRADAYIESVQNAKARRPRRSSRNLTRTERFSNRSAAVGAVVALGIGAVLYLIVHPMRSPPAADPLRPDDSLTRHTPQKKDEATQPLSSHAQSRWPSEMFAKAPIGPAQGFQSPPMRDPGVPKFEPASLPPSKPVTVTSNRGQKVRTERVPPLDLQRAARLPSDQKPFPTHAPPAPVPELSYAPPPTGVLDLVICLPFGWLSQEMLRHCSLRADRKLAADLLD
jgi:hypothetical protein